MSQATRPPSTTLGGYACQRARPILGTLVEISAQGVCAQTIDTAVTQAFVEVQRIHDLMSYHDPTSDVSRLNRAGAVCITVHRHTWQVLRIACEVAQASNGYFDVSVAPELVRHGYLPRHTDFSRPALGANWQHIELLPGHQVRLVRPLHLDLGGIAKGYAVDCAISVLRGASMYAGLVNAGGDMRMFGDAAQLIHVRHPRAPTRLLPLCKLSQGAIATSATYYSGRRVRGRSVSPLIDARSRRPCDGVRSVSVVADDCSIADALTKVVYADPAHALTTLEHFGAHAMLLDADPVASQRCRARISSPSGWRDLNASNAGVLDA